MSEEERGKAETHAHEDDLSADLRAVTRELKELAQTLKAHFEIKDKPQPLVISSREAADMAGYKLSATFLKHFKKEGYNTKHNKIRRIDVLEFINEKQRQKSMEGEIINIFKKSRIKPTKKI